MLNLSLSLTLIDRFENKKSITKIAYCESLI